MEKLEVAIVLTVEQINMVLTMIADRPLKDVIDLFTRIRIQADKAVADATKRIADAQVAQQEQANGNREQPDAPEPSTNGAAGGAHSRREPVEPSSSD